VSPAIAKESYAWYGQLDFASIAAQFPATQVIFSKSIDFEDGPSTLPLGDYSRISSGGIVVLEGPKAGALRIASITRGPLDAVANFLCSAGCLKEFKVERIFSPEEDLFEPYFAFLSKAYNQLISDERVRPSLQTAFDHFQKGDYVHSVSTLGLIAEVNRPGIPGGSII
jgi:hypothetical protein